MDTAKQPKRKLHDSDSDESVETIGTELRSVFDRACKKTKILVLDPPLPSWHFQPHEYKPFNNVPKCIQPRNATENIYDRVSKKYETLEIEKGDRFNPNSNDLDHMELVAIGNEGGGAFLNRHPPMDEWRIESFFYLRHRLGQYWQHCKPYLDMKKTVKPLLPMFQFHQSVVLIDKMTEKTYQAERKLLR